MGLPQPVMQMCEAILEAVRSGKLEDLRIAIEMNELKPVIGDGANDDPIAPGNAISPLAFRSAQRAICRGQ